MDVTIFATLVAATIILNVIVAFARNKNKEITFSSYAADPNKYGAKEITMSLIGTIVGGGMFLAVGQIGYEAGILGYILGVVYLVGLFVMGSFVFRMRALMDTNNANTLIDLIGALLSRRIVYLFSSVSFVLYLFLLAGQFVGISIITGYLSNLLGDAIIPHALAGLAVMALFLYPIIGGLRKDIQTDIVQFGLVIIACGITLSAFFGSPTESLKWNKVPPELLTGTAYGEVFLIGLVIFYVPSFLVRMDFWQRVRAAKNESAGKIAFLVGGLLSLLFFIIFTTLGIWARATDIANAEFATIEVLYREILNPYSFGLVMGAFYAAVLSSADTFINNGSLFLTRMVYSNLWEKAKEDNEKERSLLWRSRLLAILIVIASIGLALKIPDFVNLMIGAFSLLLIFLPLVFGLLYEGWRNEVASFWSSIIALLVFLILFFTWNEKLAFAPAVLIAIVIYSIMVIFKKGRTTEEL
jgi:Na+/proline symporter